jgi:hypothetical protein
MERFKAWMCGLEHVIPRICLICSSGFTLFFEAGRTPRAAYLDGDVGLVFVPLV